MPQDIIDQIEAYRSAKGTESGGFAKLASNVQWRRLVLLLLREIVVELRTLLIELRTLNHNLQSTPGQDR